MHDCGHAILPNERIWSGDDVPVLRLITSAGAMGPTGSRVDNDIVYAELVD